MKRDPKDHQDTRIVYYSEEHLTSKLKHINIDTHLTIKRKSFGKKPKCCNCVVTPRSVWLLQWPCLQVGLDSLISYKGHFSGDLHWKISNPWLCQASLFWLSSWSQVSWGVIKRISMTGTRNHFFPALIIEDPIWWLTAVNLLYHEGNWNQPLQSSSAQERAHRRWEVLDKWGIFNEIAYGILKWQKVHFKQ